MKTEENVYEGADKAAEEIRDTKKASAVLGKFRSVDALAEAYGALQAEFTRRSQRLKELERIAENSKTREAEGAENLAAEAAKPETEKLGAGGSETPAADADERGGLAQSIGSEVVPTSPSEAPRVEMTRNMAQEGSGSPLEDRKAANDGELYKAASENESVRLKIIGDYLSSLKKPQAILVKGGGGTLATPPLKAKTISEAGQLALRYFKKD
jgi:hypothetical protein